MATSQQCYKRYCDLQVQVITTFRPGGWAFLDRPPLTATSQHDMPRAALSPYNKSHFRSMEPYRVKVVCTHSHVIDKHGIVNVASTDHATRALRTEHPVLTHSTRTRQ